MATPEMRAAYRAFQRAKMRPPMACEQCGGKHEYDALQAHHDDYSKPLEVRWLCRSCHQRHHDAISPRKKRSAA